MTLLAASGWSTWRSVADAVAAAGLPAVTAEYLDTAFSADQWRVAELAVSALRDRFAGARFADEAVYGVMLIPDPERLDTRPPMDPALPPERPGPGATAALQRRPTPRPLRLQPPHLLSDAPPPLPAVKQAGLLSLV